MLLMNSIIGAGFKARFLGLCGPPLLFAVLDGVLTVAGQSVAYWANPLAVNEANPVFAALLQLHPAAFAVGLVAWLVILTGMILSLPRTAALVLSITITFGHTIGSGSWLFNHFDLGYQLANGYYLLSACVLGLGIRYAFALRDTDEAPVLGVSSATRLRIGAALFGLAVLIYLVPWQG
jgi:hypothetical protein